VLFGIPLIAVGMTAVIAAMWQIAAFFYVVQPARILWYAGGYRPATFIVEELVYVGYGADDEPLEASAAGTIEGTRENLALHGLLARFPRSEAELRREVPVGTRIPVLYNRDATPDSVGGEYARVVPFDPDVSGTAWRRLGRGFITSYLPALIAVPLLLGWTRLFLRCVGADGDAPPDAVTALLSPRTGDILLTMALCFLVGGVVLQVGLFLVI
jgi:hypothetical protein